MDVQTIAVTAAVIGALATLAYIRLGAAGIQLLRDIRDERRARSHDRHHAA